MHGHAHRQDVTELDENTILVARDWGDGTTAKSGYSIVVKQLGRGDPLESTQEILRGESADMEVTTEALREPDRRLRGVLRRVPFHESQYTMLDMHGKRAMGRLTLNVLLSFAQFEREVTGERIRDKIAASKKKACGWEACRSATASRTESSSWTSWRPRPSGSSSSAMGSCSPPCSSFGSCGSRVW